MAQPYKAAVEQFVSSGFFKEGVTTGDYSEIKRQLNRFIEEYHKALCIKAVKTYGVNKWSPAEVIKPSLRQMDFAKVEYYPKP